MFGVPTLIAIAVLAGGWFLFLRPRSDITGAEARRLVGEGARLVDVRSAGEYAAGHLPGAVNVPVDQLARRLNDVGAKDRAVIVYCASGARSGAAQRTLRANGYADVRNLGAMRAW